MKKDFKNMVSNLLGNLNNTQRWLVTVIASIIIYVIATATAFSMFSSLGSKVGIGGPGGSSTASIPTPAGVVEEDANLPRTEVCPLDGDKHTKPAAEKWAKRRPLAVMIENHSESRPQSGLYSADVIYEAVAEGGITRFMAVYYCNFGDVQVGPVRSARTYYLDWLSEYNALYAHVGGANTPGPANALGQIIDYDIHDLNQFSIGFPTFWRDYQRLGHPVATEHTMYSATDKLWEVGEKRGWGATDELTGKKWDANFVSWKFNDKGSTTDKSADATKIDVSFWQNQNDYMVTWNYDSGCNCYKRANGGQPHTDLNNKQQISAKDVVVRFQTESNANDGYPGNVHLLYDNRGQGKALIFQNGKVIEGKWMKQNRLSREKFVDDMGREIELVPGQIWLQTVPTGSQVKY